MFRVIEKLEDGTVRLDFERPAHKILAWTDRIGDVPLPPYIAKDARASIACDRYQTVYAKTVGSVVAPTGRIPLHSAMRCSSRNERPHDLIQVRAIGRKLKWNATLRWQQPSFFRTIRKIDHGRIHHLLCKCEADVCRIELRIIGINQISTPGCRVFCREMTKRHAANIERGFTLLSFCLLWPHKCHLPLRRIAPARRPLK